MTNDETKTVPVAADESAANAGANAQSAEQTANPAILLGRHHDITGFASTDPTRAVLNGVHYNAKKRVLEACDGRVAVRVPVCEHAKDFPPTKTGGETLPDAIIPTAAFKRALANVPARTTLPVLGYVRVAGNGDKVTMTATDLDTEQAVTAKTIEDWFPDMDGIWPTQAPTLRIALASGLLKRIAEYAERHGKADLKTGVAITFEFTDVLEPVRFGFELENAMGEDVRAEGVLMPIRLT